ncbi:DUF4956 domain-containing protein [Adhaeretor mobilis]|uniref:DUF4956 domain-containing protein n=1 Tax=Adhaeretor mobilis TaxID=1930276 RepID=A0A517MUV6_9BACT|nr:DUF4956 domain-containing protein [Adhaeretor mobilis]QDS98656.1 hypothetical protein HG15A2_19370 [Adhaeretor mobilis]
MHPALAQSITSTLESFQFEFLGVPFFDNDLYKLAFRLLVNLVFVSVIVGIVYYRKTGNKDYVFTYFMINLMVFFICFTLKKMELEMGMALGLFAIFGILRYRTDAIPIKEMTYLFIVIGIAVINSLANRKVSYVELAFTNVMIVALAELLERLPLLRQEFSERVVYERIDLIKPENYDQLVADLQERTGLKISRIELGQIDFLRDTIRIDLFFYPEEQSAHSSGEVAVVRRDREA